MAKDVKNELETALGVLSGKGKGAKGKSPRGAERKKMWEEVKALRKECVYGAFSCEVLSKVLRTSCDQVPPEGRRSSEICPRGIASAF